MLLLTITLLVPARTALSDDRLPLCLDALQKRDKQVVDLTTRAQKQGQLATEVEAQRDHALDTAAKSSGGNEWVWGVVIAFIAGATVGVIVVPRH